MRSSQFLLKTSCRLYARASGRGPLLRTTLAPSLPVNPLLSPFPRPVLSHRNNSTATNSAVVPSKLKIYSDLSKARLSSLVVLTTSCGFLSAGLPLTLSLPTMVGASVGTALCASSASTLNQVLEVERDRKMTRTR